MPVKNRFVRSAAGDGMATIDGECTDRLIDFYRELAEGGVGLIITGGAYVHQSGKMVNSIGLYSDNVIDGYRRFTGKVHACNAKIVAQLFHPGRSIYNINKGAGCLIAPSPVKVDLTGLTPRELTEDDIKELITAFAHAARRAKEAGFDGVEFHASHGYLLHSFLSPYTNRRGDRWGGSFAKNMRFLLEIYEKTRELVTADYPILIKCNAEDYVEGGITIDLSKRIAEKISAAGFDAIEISAGSNIDRPFFFMARGDIPTNIYGFHFAGEDTKESRQALSKIFNAMKDEVKFKEAYLRPFAKEIKKVIDIPLILPGGLRTVSVMEDVLKKGDADFIGLCRPLIRDPYFPNKVKKGLKRSDCLNCNRCLTGLAHPERAKGYQGLSEHPRCYQKLYRPPHL